MSLPAWKIFKNTPIFANNFEVVLFYVVQELRKGAIREGWREERGDRGKQEERRLGEQSQCDFRSVLASRSPTALGSALLPHKS